MLPPYTAVSMTIEQFLARWAESGAAERANKDSFLNELCDVLGVERPRPTTGESKADSYVFEKDVARPKAGGVSIGRIDLYKEGCFLLEAKMRAATGPQRRDSPAWNQMMSAAHGQALGYAANLSAPPPFLLVCDLGYCIDVYASFDGTGLYRPYPDGQTKRIFLRDLAVHADLLRTIWTAPEALDPAKISAAVTRDIADQIAALARALEAAGHPPERVATFLMRCLFTMFSEDVGLLQDRVFTRFLEEYWLPRPETFQAGVASLWKAMDEGADFLTGKLLRFNGGLFATHEAPRLFKEQLILLLMAAKSDWSQVDPSIFGTLLERALNPKERHRLGAHYTPRAYVERLVRPTIEEPLRQDWDLTRAEVRQLVEEGKIVAAQERVTDFHHQLCRTRVLDPACGTGNFLFVTLDLFKRLESEILGLLTELGYAQIGLEMETYRVTPEQFLGLEVKPWAKEIAELVLWIGYLQWQVRQPGGALTVPQPVLRDYGNIQCRDAVLAWDRVEPLLDEAGQPVSRWDGETTKRSPVTGEEIPDDTARVAVVKYINPRRAEWPAADFIVGNPPYIGNKRMRLALGDGYVEALRKAHDDVPETADLVMYWWNHAAGLVGKEKARRFGLITTNSITQTFNRKVVEKRLRAEEGLSIVFAVPDHPWVDSVDGAAVRVAMTALGRGQPNGRLLTSTRESLLEDGSLGVDFLDRLGLIHADLTLGVDSSQLTPLSSNAELAFRGITLVGDGFLVTGSAFQDSEIVLPFVGARSILSGSEPRRVIDLFGLNEDEARRRFPAEYQKLFDTVRPLRLQQKRDLYAQNWWIFAEPRPGLRKAAFGLARYICTVETAKHRWFTFVEGRSLPEQTVVAILVAEGRWFGVLSSRVHVAWTNRLGATLEDRPRYSIAACFDPFPFPACTEPQKARIRDLGESLDAHRKRQQSLHPKLTITGMYNVLEKLRSGEPLNEKEREIHEQGLVSILRQIHDDLDAAVFDAYGWPASLSDDEILERLVALNRERAEEEKRGLIRWLRPEFQNPRGARPETQATLAEAGLETPAGKAAAGRVAKTPWPKRLADRVAIVRDLLAEVDGAIGEATAADLAKRLRGTNAGAVEAVLESLAAVGRAQEISSEPGGRSWRALR